MQKETEFLTIQEVAKMLNCKVGLVNKLRKQKKISYIKIGTLVRFDKAEIIRQLKENTEEDYF